MDEKIVTVYVRRVDGGKTRNLSFQPPPEISQDDVLDRDMAIDGNSVLADIEPYNEEYAVSRFRTLYGHPNFDQRDSKSGSLPRSRMGGGKMRCGGDHHSVGGALSCAQQGLREWLAEFGYKVTFN